MRKDLSGEVLKTFLDCAAEQELDLNEIPSHVPLSQLAVKGQAYFYTETPDKQKLFGRITGKNYPLQFGREVMAHEKLLDMSSRVDWKACVTDKASETDMVKEFRKNFSPFDFTLE